MHNIRDYEPLFDGWKIEGFLGQGSYGEVYKISKEDNMGITYHSAVKRISISDMGLKRNPKLLDMFETGIESMMKMRECPYIVRIEEFTTKDWDYGGGRDILIRMELLTSLESIIDYGEKAMPIEEIRKLGIHICRILEICEEKNIIHRDIKPGNIFCSEMGNYKLGDFGVARIMDDAMSSSAPRNWDFTAPEIFLNGYERYDKRADICSLGITLYYLLNRNKIPFQMDKYDRTTLVKRVMNGEKLPMPTGEGIPQEFTEAVLKACEHNPNDRFENATLMREALEGR